MTTLTYPEAQRARESAWRRLEIAQDDRDAWAGVIADNAVRGRMPVESTADRYLASRAGAFEADADWRDALRMCEAVR